MKWIFRLARRFLPDDHPLNEEKQAEDRYRVDVTISRYQDLSDELRSVIDADNFAKYLRYEGRKKVPR